MKRPPSNLLITLGAVALLKAGQSDVFSGAGSIFADNGITPDEFDGYLERNYSGLPAYELFDMLQYKPTAAREMLEELKG